VTIATHRSRENVVLQDLTPAPITVRRGIAAAV